MKNGFFQTAFNSKRGYFRLMFVLSILIAGFLGRQAGHLSNPTYEGWYNFLITFFTPDSITHHSSSMLWGQFFAVFIASFVFVWMVYLIIFWIARGFAK